METLLGSALLRHMSWFGRLRYLLLDRHFGRTLYVGMVGLCLLGTLVSAFLLREIWGPSDIIKGFLPAVAVVGLGIVVFAYTRMSWMPVILILVSTLVADGVGTGTGTKLTFTFLMLNLWLVVWLFKMLVVERKLNIIPSIANWPILAFCVVVVLSTIWSSIYVDPNVRYFFSDKLFPRLMTALVLIISPLTVLMLGNSIRNEHTLRTIVWWFIAVGFVFGVMRIGLGGVINPLNDRGQFATWVVMFAAGQFFFNRRLSLMLRILLLVTIAMWIYVVLGLGFSWLSGWLPTFIGLVLISLIYSRKMLIPLGLAVLIYVIANFGVLEENFGTESEGSGVTRSNAWTEAFDVTSDHLLLGTGPAGYEFYFLVRGVYSGGIGTGQLAHNNYVDIVAQLGLAGILAWLTIWGTLGVISVRTYRSVPADESGFISGLKATLLAAWPVTILTMMLGDWITPFTYTQGLAGIDYTIWHWVMPGMSLALYAISQTKLAQRQPSPST
ncbi:MAG: O-antigen ligase family protein [Anaerolineae bacterium]|nr:O-antigen ligase family protein [Anaerolineae bacterium]